MIARYSLQPIDHRQIKLTGGLLAQKQEINREKTLTAIFRQSYETGRIDAFKLEWTATSGKPRPHYFWDSDVYKLLEAAAYSLGTHADAEMEAELDRIIELICKAQQPDGYLNIYFTVVEPKKRWTNLRDWHELYCAGHLFEAAVAVFNATGKRKLLEAACRFADLIDATFGRETGKKRGYPGHEEIELALIKLYRCTGEKRYLRLAKYFIDERGQQPHYFDGEVQVHGIAPGWHYLNGHQSNQSHLPVRQQKEAVGHAVRAMYLYSGMADVAAELHDDQLLQACETIWDNLVTRRMYITGGIGSTHRSEGFTRDYDLPNRLAYAETCAAVGLIFWAHRMLQFDCDSRYADILETSLYNGALSGVGNDGQSFFYVNPLQSDGNHHRQKWFDCACCPSNISRLLASIGGYIYSIAPDLLAVHLFAASAGSCKVAGVPISFSVHTDYPWTGDIEFHLDAAPAAEWTLALRLPNWCHQACLTVNHESVEIVPLVRNGYVHLRRTWKTGDMLQWQLEMPVEQWQSHPQVENNTGRVALRRGPLVYCLEQEDNGSQLHQIAIEPAAQWSVEKCTALPQIAVLAAEAWRETYPEWPDRLYQAAQPAKCSRVRIKAIPYCFWDNRAAGEMLVWIRRLLPPWREKNRSAAT